MRPNGTILYDVQELTHRPYKGISNTMAQLDPDQSGAFAMVIPDQNIVKWHMKTI